MKDTLQKIKTLKECKLIANAFELIKLINLVKGISLEVEFLFDPLLFLYKFQLVIETYNNNLNECYWILI